MSTNWYPSLKVEPLTIDGWPVSLSRYPEHGLCPVCGARWKTIRSYRLIGGEGPYKPHIAYACGGIWSDDGSGYWNGRCWAPKKQLELQLQEEA